MLPWLPWVSKFSRPGTFSSTSTFGSDPGPLLLRCSGGTGGIFDIGGLLFLLSAASKPTSAGRGRSFASHLARDEFHAQFGDCLARIESLRTRLGAIEDGVAAIEAER